MTAINILTVLSNGEFSLSVSSPLSLYLFISLLQEHMKLAAQPLMSHCDIRHHGRRGKYSPAVSILEDGKRKCSESRLPSPSSSSSSGSLDIPLQIFGLRDQVSWCGHSWGTSDTMFKSLRVNGNIPA